MNTDALLNALQSELKHFSPSDQNEEVGVVTEVADGIARVQGLPGVMAGEMLVFEGEVTGIAQNLEQGIVGVIIVDDFRSIKEGDIVRRTGRMLAVPVAKKMLGRVLDPLMRPIDGRDTIAADAEYPVEKIAPGVMTREPVTVPLLTGIKAIDAAIPIGRGQRELIIGDRQTGKTAIAIDAIINQKGQNVIAIYVAIAQKRSKVARIVAELEAHGAMEYTTVVLASASDSPSSIYMAPYSATALAEYFMDQGKDVLIVYDDLSKHAVAYREISLLLRRPPGREAYPGDVFYIHSRLLERACRRNKASGGGSITALPIIETQAGDVSAYIPTNVISITDGQIYLESNLFYKAVRPAVNLGLSVSRVGSSAQRKPMKKVAGKIKLQMAQYRELESFAQFASDLDTATRQVLERGARVQEILKQPQYAPVPASLQVALFFAVNEGGLDQIPLEQIPRWEAAYRDFLQTTHASLLKKLESEWDDGIESALRAAVAEFAGLYSAS